MVCAFNNQVFGTIGEYIKLNSLTNENFKVVAIGKKAMNFAQKMGSLLRKLLNFGNMVKSDQMDEVSDLVIGGFLAGG